MKNYSILISKKQLTDRTPLNDNLDFDYVLPHIYSAQDLMLAPVLGQALLDDLLTKVKEKNTTPISEDDQTLLDDYITPFMGYATLVKSLPSLSIKLVNSGVVQRIADDSTPISLEEIQTLVNNYRLDMDDYKQRLIDYLCANEKLYPKFRESESWEVKPSGYNFDQGIGLSDVDDCGPDCHVSSSGGGASTFTELTDTPENYTGESGKFVQVKNTEDGLQFVAASGVGNLLSDGSVPMDGGYSPDADQKIATKKYVDDNIGPSGVLSVTGDGVDNTDPANPVMSFPSPDDIGLGNVDNTSDADKPISTAQQAALDLKLNKAGDIPLDPLYVPAADQDIATKKYVDDNSAPGSAPGSFDRSFFTAETETTSEGTFYKSLVNDRGAVATTDQIVIADDNTRDYFAQDLISQPAAFDDYIPFGVYSGTLSVMENNDAGDNHKYGVEIYLADNNGLYIDSGITGAPIGSYGVRVVTIMDSGEILLNNNEESVVSIIGVIEEKLDFVTGQRFRFRTFAEKVGSAGGATTFTIYYGSNHLSLINVPKAFNSDEIVNASTVDGANVSQALESLAAKPALYNATTTGTVILDCSTFDSWYRILTGNTDFQFSNTPAAGKTFVKNLQVITTAGESLTFTTADQVIGTFSNDNTTLNLITISFANYPTIGLYISVVISQ